MIFKLLLSPFTGPPAGLRLLLQQLESMAERELFDLDKLHEDLILLQHRLEEGEVTEEEFQVREADILARVREVRNYQLQKAGK